jgi:hypothetical protein
MTSRAIVTSPNLEDPDGFYADLVAAHQGLSAEESELLNARLVLILANQVGDREVLRQALALARGQAVGASSGGGDGDAPAAATGPSSGGAG